MAKRTVHGIIVDAGIGADVHAMMSDDPVSYLKERYPGIRMVQLMQVAEDCAILMDEDGLARGLEPNVAVTRALGLPYDLVGPVAITGIDSEGLPTDLPDAWFRRVMDARATLRV
jgi:hypothetical protein